MLKPKDMYDLNQINSPYANVIAISKLARKIGEDADEKHIIMDEKPLKIAIEDFVEDKYRVSKISIDED